MGVPGDADRCEARAPGALLDLEDEPGALVDGGDELTAEELGIGGTSEWSGTTVATTMPATPAAAATPTPI